MDACLQVDAYHTAMELLQQPALAPYRGRAAIAAENHPAVRS
jgi:hypothetical protein